MEITDFITKEFIWLVPCLVAFGGILKQIPKFPNWCIPISTLFVSVCIAGLYMDWTTAAIIQGFICGLAATGTHQLIKQPIDRIKEEK